MFTIIADEGGRAEAEPGWHMESKIFYIFKTKQEKEKRSGSFVISFFVSLATSRETNLEKFKLRSFI